MGQAACAPGAGPQPPDAPGEVALPATSWETSAGPASSSPSTSSSCRAGKTQTLNSAPDPDHHLLCTAPKAPACPAAAHTHPWRPCPHVFRWHDTELPLRSVLGADWSEEVEAQGNQEQGVPQPSPYLLPGMFHPISALSPRLPVSADATLWAIPGREPTGINTSLWF